MNIFNLELFNHTVQLLQMYSMNHETVPIMTLIISHKNANLLLKLVRNITFKSKYTSFLHTVIKLPLFIKTLLKDYSDTYQEELYNVFFWGKNVFVEI